MSMLRYCIPNGGDILLNLTHTMGIFAEWKAAESGNNFLYHLFWFLYYNDQFKMHNKFKQTKSKRTGQSPQPQPDGEGDPRGYKCTCWITKIFEHLLEGRKRWTNLISREAWQLVSNAYKYKAESLAFLRCKKGNSSHKKCFGQSTNNGQIIQHKRALPALQRPQHSHRGRGC